jgi:hypothetical protein
MDDFVPESQSAAPGCVPLPSHRMIAPVAEQKHPFVKNIILSKFNE